MKNSYEALIYKLLIGLFLIFPFSCKKSDYNNSNNTINTLKNGLKSDSLFTLPTGINEFDILYANNEYHLFYDDKTRVKHRCATSLMGLSTAQDNIITSVGERYPAAYFDREFWHL